MGWWPLRWWRDTRVPHRPEPASAPSWWRSIPPVQRTVPDASLVTAPDAFNASLATVTVPAMLGVLTGTLRTGPETVLNAAAAHTSESAAPRPPSSTGTRRWVPHIPTQRIVAASSQTESAPPPDPKVGHVVAEAWDPNPELISAEAQEEPRDVPVIAGPVAPTPRPEHIPVAPASSVSRSDTGTTSLPESAVVQRTTTASPAEFAPNEETIAEDSTPGRPDSAAPSASSGPAVASVADTAAALVRGVTRIPATVAPMREQLPTVQRTPASQTHGDPPQGVVGETPPQSLPPTVSVQRRQDLPALEPEHEPEFEVPEPVAEFTPQPRDDDRQDLRVVAVPERPTQAPVATDTSDPPLDIAAAPTGTPAVQPRTPKSFTGSPLVQRLAASALHIVSESATSRMPGQENNIPPVQPERPRIAQVVPRARVELPDGHRHPHERESSTPPQRHNQDPVLPLVVPIATIRQDPIQRAIPDLVDQRARGVEPVGAPTVRGLDPARSSQDPSPPSQYERTAQNLRPAELHLPSGRTDAAPAQRVSAAIDSPATIRAAVPTFQAPPASAGIDTSLPETMTSAPALVTATLAAESVTAPFPIAAPRDRPPGRRSVTGTALQRAATATDAKPPPALSIGTLAPPAAHRAAPRLGRVVVGAPLSSPPSSGEPGDSGWTIVRATDSSGVSLQRMFEPASVQAPQPSESAAPGPPTAALSGTGAFVQREAGASPTSPEPGTPVSAGDTTATLATGGSSPPGPGNSAPGIAGNLDELAARLYEPLAARLRAELWHDRERTGTLTDLGR